jgi:hypothetical protein
MIAHSRVLFFFLCGALLAAALPAWPQAQSPPPSSSSAKPIKKPATQDSTLDSGAVTNGVYHNKSLALSCKIPPGWVLRTDELNARQKQEEEKQQEDKQEEQKAEEKKEEQKPEEKPAAAPPLSASSAGAKVLLAAFSRPPEARAEDVNSSILIAAESAASYPGLQEAAQYFFPLTEVAKAQGFTPDEDPYEIAIGTKTLPRADFHKDVGTRVMHQSTLAMLAHGYAISITIIAGTDDEVEDLIDGLTFTQSGK